jgi:hypothetical protein
MTPRHKNSGRNYNIVSQSDNSGETVFPRRHRLGHFAESECDKKNDANNNHNDSSHSFVFQFGADSRTD